MLCIPYMRNRQFVGRYTELETLERFVNTALESPWGGAPRGLAVFGPAGIGKTQLVLSLAFWVAVQHADVSVFWLPATSFEAFTSAADIITRQLGIRTPANAGEDVKELLKRHLSVLSAGKWLLIVDNADGTETLEPSASSDGLLRYLPQSMFGVTVFTTRSASLAQRFAGRELLRLKKLPENEAVEILTEYIIDANLLADPIAVTTFLAVMEHAPLAITRAAAYINDNGISLPEYSRLFPSTGPATSSALDSALQQKPQRRHRRVAAPYAYPAADTSAVQYAPHDIEPPQTSSAPGSHSPSLHNVKKLAALQRIRPCFLMIALGFLAISGSLAVGIYYSVSKDRMGDGFTTAGWIVAVSTLILAAPMAKHYPKCHCWDGGRYAVL